MGMGMQQLGKKRMEKQLGLELELGKKRKMELVLERCFELGSLELVLLH